MVIGHHFIITFLTLTTVGIEQPKQIKRMLWISLTLQICRLYQIRKSILAPSRFLGNLYLLEYFPVLFNDNETKNYSFSYVIFNLPMMVHWLVALSWTISGPPESPEQGSLACLWSGFLEKKNFFLLQLLMTCQRHLISPINFHQLSPKHRWMGVPELKTLVDNLAVKLSK